MKYVLVPDKTGRLRPRARSYTQRELVEVLEQHSIVRDTGYRSPCWLWRGYRDYEGYGKMTVKGCDTAIHRLVWELWFGAIPKGKCVLHRCDQPACWRPFHLFVGTVEDNNKDRSAKGRSVHGEKSPVSKLRARDVIQIRQRYPQESLKQLAKAFGVSWPAIWHIVRRRSWNHL